VTVESLTTTLVSHGIILYLEGDALRFRAPKGVLTAELKQQIAEHRGEIIAHLRPPAPPRAPRLSAACRCDSRDWVDDSPQNGQIRTRCGQCGRFIGYRPENVSPGCRRTLESGRPA
jgi:hypothetical protein